MIAKHTSNAVNPITADQGQQTAAGPGKVMMPLLLSLMLMATRPASGEELATIATFQGPACSVEWRSINDGVMGGISSGGFVITEHNTLRFSGSLSLANNGGFASIRTTAHYVGLADAEGIIIRSRGDGRTYWVDLRTSGQHAASSYRAYLPTAADEFTITVLPLTDFKLQAFGRALPGRAINPSDVISIGFTIADKQAGPFALEIDYIKSFTKAALLPAQ
ncbi:MAG: CIA30 family protein [Planctomycetota bacterium]|jgi:hypothetical protein